MAKARKERPLTDGQVQCLLAAEPTLYGDIKVVPGLYGRSVYGLRRRGLVEGEKAHSYLSTDGRFAMSPIEQRIIAHLETARGRLANSGEIRRAVGAKSDECVRVLVHRLRNLWSIEITSTRGRFGGYQLTAPSA